MGSLLQMFIMNLYNNFSPLNPRIDSVHVRVYSASRKLTQNTTEEHTAGRDRPEKNDRTHSFCRKITRDTAEQTFPAEKRIREHGGTHSAGRDLRRADPGLVLP